MLSIIGWTVIILLLMGILWIGCALLNSVSEIIEDLDNVKTQLAKIEVSLDEKETRLTEMDVRSDSITTTLLEFKGTIQTVLEKVNKLKQ